MKQKEIKINTIKVKEFLGENFILKNNTKEEYIYSLDKNFEIVLEIVDEFNFEIEILNITNNGIKIMGLIDTFIQDNHEFRFYLVGGSIKNSILDSYISELNENLKTAATGIKKLNNFFFKSEQ